MSDVRQSDWLFLPTPDTVGTPEGNSGLARAPLCKQCEQKHLIAHGGGTISAISKTKVGGKLTLCSFAKFVLPVEYEKHMPRPAKVYP